ncbi:ABC transporter permease subunit [Limnochorda pilosa]|uniref:Uncharacterized protein n=1 Tax=Limnochorda pilosa TaxID=1555112 RepID=A0A0K2SIF9_LIMPI|nr:ABC transporter permease subunit [Limnochorda pilosa]BAS26893.1 hypothetical protein LIP_1036 [Limnochorda pilosa]
METWRRLLYAEAVKLRRLRLIWIALGLLLLFVGLAYYLSYEGYQTILDRMRAEGGPAPGLQAVAARAYFLNLLKQMITLPRAVDVAFSVLQFPGFLMITLVAAAVVGNEFAWGTVQQNLMRGATRPTFLTAKLTAVALVVLLFMAAGLAAGIVAGGITGSAVSGWSWSWATGRFWLDVLGLLGRLALINGVYAAMAVMLSILFRSTAIGVGATVIYRFFEGVAGLFLGQTSRWIGHVYPYLISSGHLALTADRTVIFMGGGPGGPSSPGGPGGPEIAFQKLLPFPDAVWLMTGFLALFVAVSYLRFQRQDLL